jgi:hypothetical protein
VKAFNPLGALEALLEAEVDFVLIGGLAARLHGSPTVTDDLDISHAKERANLERLAACLSEMNATLRLPDPDERVDIALDWRLLHAADNFTFTTDFGPLDCLALPAGIESYGELASRALMMKLGGKVGIRVASIDDLMAMKNAAGRRKDLIELEILAALKEELGGLDV